jgi:hypothetical protein
MPRATHTRRELAHRVTGGLEITLYWNPHDDSTSITVHQLTSWETISFPVPRDLALHAFHHPFAHLPQQDAAEGASHTPQDSGEARIRR